MVSTLIALPVIGALAMLFISKGRREAFQKLAALVTGVAFVLSLVAWAAFAPNPETGFAYMTTVDWLPALGVQYKVGLDGLSLLLVVLTNLLTFVSVLSSFSYITRRDKEYYIFLLLLQAGIVGAFSALDLFLFFVFWEVMLVPLYFLIGIWGSSDRIYAAIKFFLFTLVGSVLMLIGILWIYFHTGTLDATLIPTLLAENPPTHNTQLLLFAAFFLAFAIKVPMWPVHTWLPDAHTEAPTAGSVILAGVLLKTGVYGMLRFCIPFFPDAALAFQWPVMILSVVAIIYGAYVVIGLIIGPAEQADIKRMIAYSSVSHMGFVTLGIFAFTASGLQGGMLQLVNHGLSTGALFLLIGMLYERRHTRLMNEYGGLAAVMPVYATCFMVAMLASVGLPLLNGFIGEFLILLGVLPRSFVLCALAASGVILAAVYLLWIYQRVFFGPLSNEKNQALADCSPRELTTVLPLLAVCFWIGLYPAPFLNMLEPTSRAMVEHVNEPWHDTLLQDNLPQASTPHDDAHGEDEIAR